MKCPTCGEELPLLSKVCPQCRTVVDREDGAPDALSLSSAIDEVVVGYQKLVPEAKGLRLASYVPLYLLIAGVFCGLIGLRSGAALLWVLALGFVVAAAIVYRKHKKSKLSVRLSDTNISYDYGSTLVRRFYSGNAEMIRFIRSVDEKVDRLKADIRKGQRRSVLVGVGVALAEAVLLSLVVAAIPARSAGADDGIPAGYAERITYFLDAGQPEEAILTYARSDYNDDLTGAAQRVALCEQLCQGGYAAEAARFCSDYCLGKMQDYDCARIVVQAYLTRGDRSAAADFVRQCATLRYKSDQKKLEALLR